MSRDDRGRFAEGNAGGPGRPRRETERSYLTAISEACPPETWQRIVERAVKDAEAGDAAARAWLASYLVGKPKANAPTLRAIAVDELAGVDDLEEAAATHKQLADLTRLMR